MNIINKEFLCKILYPEDYNIDYIKTYYSLNSELENLIEKSGYKNEFKKKYFKSLKFLVNLKEKCTEQSSLFEKLKNVECDLYSIKLHGNKNIRILFIFKKVSNIEYVILLNAFQEKEKSDYSEGISVAYDRIKKIEQVLYEEDKYVKR